jgi:uncharacterized protein (DUF1330 family)
VSVYLIAQLEIHDRGRYAQYVAGFMEVFERYGGKLLAVDEAPKPIEGEWDWSRTVLIEFASEDRANDWYHSGEYQALAAHRFASSKANIVMIKGLT